MDIWIKVIIGGVVYYWILWHASDEPGIVSIPSIGFSIFLSVCFLFTKIWWQLLIAYWSIFVIMPLVATMKKQEYNREKEHQEYLKRQEWDRKKTEESILLNTEERKEERIARDKERKAIDEEIDGYYHRWIDLGLGEERAKNLRKTWIEFYEGFRTDIYYKYNGEGICKDESNKTEN